MRLFTIIVKNNYVKKLFLAIKLIFQWIRLFTDDKLDLNFKCLDKLEFTRSSDDTIFYQFVLANVFKSNFSLI